MNNIFIDIYIPPSNTPRIAPQEQMRGQLQTALTGLIEELGKIKSTAHMDIDAEHSLETHRLEFLSKDRLIELCGQRTGELWLAQNNLQPAASNLPLN